MKNLNQQSQVQNNFKNTPNQKIKRNYKKALVIFLIVIIIFYIWLVNQNFTGTKVEFRRDAIRTNALSQVRFTAEIIYDQNKNSYESVCDGSGKLNLKYPELESVHKVLETQEVTESCYSKIT